MPRRLEKQYRYRVGGPTEDDGTLCDEANLGLLDDRASARLR
jgi:hypothetical protein